MNIVVFGANGFLGKHLVEALAKDKDLHIRAFDRFSKIEAGKFPFQAHENVEVRRGDFLDREAVRNATKDREIVFHLVSGTTPATSSDNHLADLDTIRASVQLLEVCVESGVKKVVYFSSGGSVYGFTDHKAIHEDTPLLPVSPYAIGKATVEHYLHYFNVVKQLDYITYRIANPYGPGQSFLGKQGVIPIFMHRILEGKPITIYGDGKMVRDYLYVDDLVEMVLASYAQPSKHHIYNIGSGHGKSVLEVVANIEQVSGLRFKKTYSEVPAVYVPNIVLDIKKFTDEFNISPKTDFTAGIKKTWEFINGKK